MAGAKQGIEFYNEPASAFGGECRSDGVFTIVSRDGTVRIYLRDGRSVIFAFRYMNGTTFRRIILVVLLPSGLLLLASSFVELLKRFEGRTVETLQIANPGASCALCRHRHSCELRALSAS
jgi:hypothetical protein